MGVLAIVGREVPRIDARDGRRPDLRPPPDDDGAAGAHGAGRERRALHARHRAVAPDRDRGHVRAVVREAGAAHARVPRRADAAVARGQVRRSTGETISTHAALDIAATAHRRCRCSSRRSGPKMLELAGTRRRRHRHVDDRARRRSRRTPCRRSPPRPSARAVPRRESFASLPICVTDDADAARGACRARLPGLRLPAFVPGDARPRRRGRTGRRRDRRRRGDRRRRSCGRLADAGTTEFVASIIGNRDERAETRALLKSMI